MLVMSLRPTSAFAVAWKFNLATTIRAKDCPAGKRVAIYTRPEPRPRNLTIYVRALAFHLQEHFKFAPDQALLEAFRNVHDAYNAMSLGAIIGSAYIERCEDHPPGDYEFLRRPNRALGKSTHTFTFSRYRPLLKPIRMEEPAEVISTASLDVAKRLDVCGTCAYYAWNIPAAKDFRVCMIPNLSRQLEAGSPEPAIVRPLPTDSCREYARALRPVATKREWLIAGALPDGFTDDNSPAPAWRRGAGL